MFPRPRKVLIWALFSQLFCDAVLVDKPKMSLRVVGGPPTSFLAKKVCQRAADKLFRSSVVVSPLKSSIWALFFQLSCDVALKGVFGVFDGREGISKATEVISRDLKANEAIPKLSSEKVSI